MDMSLVLSTLSNQAASVRSQAANSFIKQNLDHERQVVTTLLDGAVESMSQANLAAGVGSNLNVRA